jgi:hypothetical protein
MLRKTLSLLFYFLLVFSLSLGVVYSAKTVLDINNLNNDQVSETPSTTSTNPNSDVSFPKGKTYFTYNGRSATVWTFENEGDWVDFQRNVKDGSYFEAKDLDSAKIQIQSTSQNSQADDIKPISKSNKEEYSEFLKIKFGKNLESVSNQKVFLEIAKTGDMNVEDYENTLEIFKTTEEEIINLEKKINTERAKGEDVKSLEDTLNNKKSLVETIKEGIGIMPTEDFAQFTEAVNSLEDEELKKKILQAQEDAVAQRECGSGTFSFICRNTKDFSLDAQRQRAFLEDVNKLRANFQDTSKKTGIPRLDTARDGIVSAQNDLDACSDKSCREEKEKKLNNVREEYKEIYNEELLNSALESFDINQLDPNIKNIIKQNCDFSADGCASKIEKSPFCTEDPERCKKVLAQLELADSTSLVQQNLFAEITQLFFNPDPAAIGALSLFGIEADYSYLPSFLREDVASQLCLAKIGGYLDKEVKSGGGVSLYNTEEFNRDIEAFADLRAQRTAITPDERVEVSYSAFLRNQEDRSFQYILAVSFVSQGVREKVSIFDEPKSLGQGGIASEFDTISIPLNNTERIDPNSFTIHLLAVYSGTQDIAVNLDYPIILITGGDIIAGGSGGVSGNSQGNVQAQQNTQQASLSTDSLLSLLG